MSTKIQLNRVTNANIYIDGTNLLGRAEEISNPMIVFKDGEHKALGMIGTFNTFAGIEKMEAKIKWNAIYSDVRVKFANPFENVKLMIRASVEQYGSSGREAEVPYVLYLTCATKGIPTGNFKQHDNVELETSMHVYAVKEEIDGKVTFEIDVLANIFSVDGVDLLANYRTNIGG